MSAYIKLIKNDDLDKLGDDINKYIQSSKLKLESIDVSLSRNTVSKEYIAILMFEPEPKKTEVVESVAKVAYKKDPLDVIRSIGGYAQLSKKRKSLIEEEFDEIRAKSRNYYNEAIRRIEYLITNSDYIYNEYKSKWKKMSKHVIELAISNHLNMNYVGRKAVHVSSEEFINENKAIYNWILEYYMDRFGDKLAKDVE